jgi:hypothetical protein
VFYLVGAVQRPNNTRRHTLKPNNVLESVREGDLGGDKIEMGIDANSFAHIMSILTDLYSDPELAVIREYSTNARDAHVEAGHPNRPIEVFTPTPIFPYFRVKDYGVGMDHDTIATVYSKYGASTKRGVDDQTGMLGLGGKSALTYTNQFTVIGVKNGIKTSVVVSRNDDGGGVMQVIDTCATDEPNGVEITIPARRGDFQSKVPHFFRFWPEGSVLINGKSNEAMPLTMLTDQIGWAKSSHLLPNDVVVMGGVAYPVSSSHARSHGDYHVAMFVNMGEVNFTPSREELHYTNLTKATLVKYYDAFDAALKDKVEAEVAAAATRGEAWALASKYRSAFGRKQFNFVWQGAGVPDSVQVKGWTLWYNRTGLTKYRYGSDFNLDHIALDDRDDRIYIHNYEGGDMSASRKNKMRKYLESIGIDDFDCIFFVEGDWTAYEWLASVQDKSIDWTVIKDFKVPRASSGRSASTGPRIKTDPIYKVMKDGIYQELKKSDIDSYVADNETTLLYFSSSEIKWGTKSEVSDKSFSAARWISKQGPVVAIIGLNRFDKFVRDFPQAGKAQDWIKDYIKKGEAALTDAEKITIGTDNLYYATKQAWVNARKHLAQIDDPEISRICGLMFTTLSDYAKDRGVAYNHGYALGVCAWTPPAFQTKGVNLEYVSKNYPLVGDLSRNVADAIIYMNAKYAAKIKDAN